MESGFRKVLVEPDNPNDKDCPLCQYSYRVSSDSRNDKNCAFGPHTYTESLYNQLHEQAVRLRVCGHVFGKRCLLEYLASLPSIHNKCPTCATKLFEIEHVEEFDRVHIRAGTLLVLVLALVLAYISMRLAGTTVECTVKK